VTPHAYLLDALGTLVELEPPAEPLRRELRERVEVEISAEEAAGAMRAEIAFYRAHHHIARDRDSLALLRRRATAALRDALPARVADVPLDALTDALLAALRFRAFPEVPDVLRRARAQGIRLVVVSDWDVSLHDVLDATGLAPLLDGVVTSAELGIGKPDPRIFRRGLSLARVEADEALHVGDTVELDVAGAQAAGIAALLLVRDGEAPPGVAAIRSLAELPGLGAAGAGSADGPPRTL
jgi:putative hydrolase of the HAD superfamily